MRRTFIAAASAAAFIAGLVGFAGVGTNAFASSGPSDSETTIHLVATVVDDNFFQPDGTKINPAVTFPSVGARDVFHDTLAYPNAKFAGDDGGECTVTTVKPTSLNNGDAANVQCVITFALVGKGEITVQQVGDHPPATVDQAVTGGTGIYRGVKGDCVVSFGPPGSNTADLVFHLTNVGHD